MTEPDTPTPSALERLFPVLWPEDSDDQVFWLMDGARDPAIVSLIEQSALESGCLYAGPLIPRLKAAAPWLVRLAADSPASLALLQKGWGKAWGILLVVPATMAMDQVRRHCKKLLRVRTEDHRVLMFRFYDPRVLSVFLPTSSPDQYQALIGPLRRVVVEEGDGEQWQVFAPAG